MPKLVVSTLKGSIVNRNKNNYTMSQIRNRKLIQEKQHSTEDEFEYEDTMSRPHAVPIVVADEDHSFKLDEEALKKVLMKEELKDRFVVVVSVAGAFRHGKSFLLDFFLRYMNAKYVLKQNTSEWVGAEEAPLEGFSWKGGSERDTTGILMWSEVYTTELSTGEKIAVILLDTQGTWDSKSTVKECATIFALSTMLSSVQIYNLSSNIQEDDLQHLQLFTEYGRLALADSGTTPFQRLQFLVRDWRFPYEAPYGAVGGQQILQKRLEVNEHQHSELQSLRRHISSCFTEIACFLMPHPGIKVATSPTFDGRLAEIDGEFKDNLKILVPMLLAPENLVLKKINGDKVKVRDFVQYCKSYMQIYEGNELPEPKSMLVATAEANNLAAVADAKDAYVNMMEEVCGGTKPYLNTELIESEHRRVKEKAIHQFNSKKKMGGDEFSAVYKTQLDKDIEDTFVQFKAHNESKNIFKSARTPAVFFALAVMFYIASGIFGFIGIYSLANLCNMMMAVAFLTLGTWAYVRYSGEMREIGSYIDETANFIWENFMKTLIQGYVENGMQQVAAEVAERTLRNATQTTVNGGRKDA
uniref:Atlastin n=2 Tax=Diabrotica virgifera virgifera TaxID=50390 RepID=A0A6P7GSB1_DIAVI